MQFNSDLADEGCKYMGTFDAGDVWVCPERDGSKTLIIKFGEEDSEYRALPLDLARNLNSDLYKQAIEIVDSQRNN